MIKLTVLLEKALKVCELIKGLKINFELQANSELKRYSLDLQVTYSVPKANC